MSYKVLVIDDDEPIHFMAKSLLGKEFSLVHARSGQEAIDILSNTSVNLILSDIHMPGLSGLELLESIRSDKRKRKIPVLIMTNLPTVEKEQRAMDLGAVDFIKKELFTTNKEKILELVMMKIVTDVHIPELEDELVQSKDRLVMKLMEKAITGSFQDTIHALCFELNAIVESNFIGFWIIDGQQSRLVEKAGDKIPEEDIISSIHNQKSFSYLVDSKEAYLSNHVFNEELGSYFEFSRENGLPAEIGVPLFSVNERALLMNNMKIPEDSELFGIIILKRAVLFSSKEFELVSRLITQAGSILWRLYKKSIA